MNNPIDTVMVPPPLSGEEGNRTAADVQLLLLLTPAEADALLELATAVGTDTATLAHRLLRDAIQKRQGAAIGGSE